MDNKDRIAIFQNDPKTEKQPSFKGFITYKGEELEFAAWPARSGKPGAYTGTIKPKQEKSNAGNQSNYEQAKSNGYQPQDLDDEVPF
jgi:hypothetical protein